MANPVCFMDITVNGQPVGRLEIVVREDIVPKTTASFVNLCRDGYKGSRVHRIIPGFMMQVGKWLGDADESTPDVTASQRVNGGKTMYGETFEDENFILRHSGAGILSMVNTGKDTNSTEFFLCATRTSWLDGKHVVFGFVRKGFDVINKISALGSSEGVPTHVVRIADCGVLESEAPPIDAL
eukprot:m.243393 g.243393  ORF g.243393 m.243393 type:complete len:183 (-) comp15834_c1_seq21:308-856(-)